MVELDHVGHGAQGDQVQQVCQVGLGLAFKGAAVAQLGAQGQHGVEHHPHAGQGLAREGAAGLVGIDDHIRLGQLVAGQVVVGDDGGDAVLPRGGHAFDAGDAVIHGDQQVGLHAGGQFDDGRGEAVAVFEAVGNQVADLGPEGPQGAHAHGTGGGAVAIVVGDDDHARTRLDGVGEDLRGVMHALELGGGQQGLQAVVELLAIVDAAGCVDAGQQGMGAGFEQAADGAAGDRAGQDAGHGVLDLG